MTSAYRPPDSTVHTWNADQPAHDPDVKFIDDQDGQRIVLSGCEPSQVITDATWALVGCARGHLRPPDTQPEQPAEPASSPGLVPWTREANEHAHRVPTTDTTTPTGEHPNV